MNGVILPRIVNVSLTRFDPLFSDSALKFQLPTGPFLLLGGNGLGKTTTLQTIVFALAGEADTQIEEKTDFQWSASLFKARLNQPNEAEIEVQFYLDKTLIGIRRRMNSKVIRGVKIGSADWTNDSSTAQQEYEKAVCDAGGYEQFEDFRYLIHRLCYLAENRRSVIWDQGAQLRIVMMICSDATMERDFRVMRATLKETDSELRHTHVDIGDLEKRLEQLTSSKKDGDSAKDKKEKDGALRAVQHSAKLEAELRPLTKQRLQLRQKLFSARKELAAVNKDLEASQIRSTELEDAFVLETLRGMENSAAALALHKLLIHERCPFCTQVTKELAGKARKAVDSGLCPICGQQHAVDVSAEDLRSLRRDAAALTKKQDALQKTVNSLEEAEAELTKQEIEITTQLNFLVAKLPRVKFADVSGVVGNNIDEVRERLRTTRLHYARLETKKATLERELQEKYADFASLGARRLAQLASLAGEYGEEFLGSPCQFVMTPSRERLSHFSYLVPEFAGKKRERPESCSESERFFLDIAFRMAVIVFAGLLSKSRSTFICETPENALDLAYTDNVASMFKKFAAQGFSMLLTANLQLGGVAKPLLRGYPKEERPKRTINLIEKCDLSDVQSKKKEEFMDVYNEIVSGDSQ